MHEIQFSIFPYEYFVDLCLYQFGHEVCEPGHSFGPVARNHYLFHYVISGTGTLMAEDEKGENQSFSIRSRQGFMIFPKQINTYYADMDNPWEYVWVEFDGLRVKEMLEIAGFSRSQPVYSARSKEQRDEMHKEMMYIAENGSEPPFHLIGHTYLFLDYLVRSMAPVLRLTGNRPKDYYIKEAITYIEQNFQNDITIEALAEMVGIDRSYFGKIFKKALGKSPQEFLMNYRMVKAAELLRMTELTVGDIGNAVGYPSNIQFSRAFRNIYGVSPSAWRKENYRGNLL